MGRVTISNKVFYQLKIQFVCKPLRECTAPSSAVYARVTLVTNVTIVTIITIVTMGVLANGSSVVVDFNPRVVVWVKSTLTSRTSRE